MQKVQYWEKIHSQDKSWRTKLIGDLSYHYVMPRYVQLFENYFADLKPSSFLELGAGNGEIAEKIAAKKFPFVSKYVASECFSEGVEWLHEKGMDSVLANALEIPFKDESFDVVLSFDVMHHVTNPARMGREMLRVGRNRLFLTESNGLSLGRKMMELTPGHRRAGEKSYTPAQYESFFRHAGYRVTRFEIHPFIFPLQIPGMLSAVIAFNRWIENVPFLQWQCSNVYIYIEYERDKA